MSILVSLGISFRSASTVPAGNLAKASSVGANTVNGPGPFKVGTRPAAVRAAASVLKDPAETAYERMFFSSTKIFLKEKILTVSTMSAILKDEKLLADFMPTEKAAMTSMDANRTATDFIIFSS